jgi:hypothetical protein
MLTDVKHPFLLGGFLPTTLPTSDCNPDGFYSPEYSPTGNRSDSPPTYLLEEEDDGSSAALLKTPDN